MAKSPWLLDAISNALKPLQKGVGLKLLGLTSGHVTLKSPDVAGTTQYTLPSANSSGGKRLEVSKTGVMSWTDPESRGAKLRRLAKHAQRTNTYLRPVMKAAPPWQPDTQYYQSNVVAHGGQLFVAFTNGISASSGGPVNQAPAGSIDNTTGWIWIGANNVTNDPSLTFVTYSNNLAVTLGQLILVANARLYAVTAAGNLSGSGSGPSGTGVGITDGGATLSYYGPYKPLPTIDEFPVFSSQTSIPSGLTNPYTFGSGTWQNVGVLSAKPIAGGSGYQVNDLITVSGGTRSVAAVLRVTSVSAGAVTGLAVQTAGSYTALPQITVGQASTTGSGTGATFALRWPDPYFLKIRGGYNGGLGSGNQLVVYTFTATPNSTPVAQHSSLEFYSDAPIISFICSTSAAFFNVIIDGRQWNAGGLPNSTTTAYNQTLDLSAYPKRARHYRLEARAASMLSGIRVDPQSQVWAPSDSDRVTAVCISDSIFQGAAYGPHVPGNAISQRLGHELGWNDVWSFTQGGTGWLNRGAAAGTTTDSYDARITEALSLNPDVIAFMGSTNDGGQSTSAVTAKVLSTLQALRASGWNGLIFVAGILSVDDTSYVSGKKITDYETAIQAAVTSFNDEQCWFIPIRNDPNGPWVTGAWNNTINTNSVNNTMFINATDKVHPCDVGHTALAMRFSNAIRNLLPYAM